MTAFFVTGAGTDIGKTWVVEGLIRRWRAEGREVVALKPVVSGFDAASPDGSDTCRILDALGQAPTAEAINAVSPWRFAAPLSPDMAAAREGREVPYAEVVDYCRGSIAAASEAGASILIEGIGGVMVPLDDSHTVLDLMRETGLPAILVGGSYLGAISHTLTACGALVAADVPVHMIVISETPDSGVPLEETRAAIARYVDPVPVEAVPYMA